MKSLSSIKVNIFSKKFLENLFLNLKRFFFNFKLKYQALSNTPTVSLTKIHCRLRQKNQDKIFEYHELKLNLKNIYK